MTAVVRDAHTRRDARIHDWRARLDARISRCPGCDQWCWDHQCPTCTTTEGAA